MVKKEHVVAFKKEMSDAKVSLLFVDYPGAKHGFTNMEATEKGKKYSLPLAYDQSADQDSWKQLQKFLKNVFEN